MRPYLSAFLLLSSLVLSLSPDVSQADIPEADKAFLDDAIPPLRALTDKALAGQPSVARALSGIRDLLAERKRVMADLGKTHPLTDLTGIETQDEYDSEAMASLRRIAAAGMASDSTHPGDAAGQPIEAVLAALPSLGKQPAPFMVLAYSGMALAVGDSLVSHGGTPMLIDHVVLDHIVAATDLAIKEGEDFFGSSAANSLRQELVVARLRCPTDGNAYKLNNMKNQVKETGDISTLYYLQCSKCGEARIIEFPQELASRLNRMSVPQKQAKPASPARSQLVEP